MGSYKYCLFFTRKFQWREAGPPADVRSAFTAYADGGPHMTSDQLGRFMADLQCEPSADSEELAEKIHTLRPCSQSRFAGLTLDDFHSFLFNVDLNPPLRSQVHHDMTAPLSHYFIYTGHNSYLTGNQLSSDCSDVPIVKALQRGVRVIELDLWPNSMRDNVHVLHGRTLTSPVELIKCLRSIKEYAFSASSYPLIITLEDHLTPDLQAKVAEMATQTFGDMLYCPESEALEEFPSPEVLRNRIILSTKPPKEYLDCKNFRDEGDDTWGREVPDITSEFENGEKNAHDRSGHCKEEDDADNNEDNLQRELALEYRSLITIPAGKPKGRLRDSLKVDPSKVGRLSLSEQQLQRAAANYRADVVRFTQKNLLRVYPKGTRFNSSNYNPLIGWMHGVQMVAFNMQGYGRSLWLMHGFYRANGGCGYVKKPDFLLKAGAQGEVFDPTQRLPVKNTLKVKVYIGYGWHVDFHPTDFGAYSPPDFYTRVGIAGVPADTLMRKTKTIIDVWTPAWDEEFSFPLTVPELALLRIEVHHHNVSEKDDFGGQNCLPVSALRPGIRAVPLFNRKGMKFNTVKLLMRFQFV